MIVSRTVACPYCRHGAVLVCASAEVHDVIRSCAGCGGTFVTRFEVSVKARVLAVEGEAERVADEQQERHELERARAVGGAR